MTSIVDQLTNDGNVNRGIPTITPDNVPEANGVASITPTPTGNSTVSIGSGGGIGRQRRNHQFQTAGDIMGGKKGKGVTRQQLDLSQFPKEIDNDIKESIQSEIFKPGGDFDKMLERKQREMQEDLARDGFAEEVATAANKISRAGRALPAGTNEALAEAGISGDDVDFDDEDFGVNDEINEDDGEDYMDAEDYNENEVAVVDMGDDFDEDQEDDFTEDDSEPSIPPTQEIPITTPDVVDHDRTEVSEEVHEQLQKPEEKPKKEVISVDEYADDFGEAGSVDDEITFEDEEQTDDTEEDRELRVKYLKEAITEKLRPVTEKLNISGFPVAKRGTKTKKKALNRPAGLAKWPLINTGIVVTTKAISGSMMELVRSHVSNNDIRSALRIMYDHIVSAKPMNFNAWTKSIDAEDLDHLFFAFYISAFQGVNYIPIDCHNPECKRKVFITDNIPFIKMVDFHEKKNKDLFNKIYKEEPQGMESDDTVSYRVAISNDIAIDFRRASLYSEYVELSFLNDAFIKKYADMINYMRNIDELYTIEDGQLIPIDYKVDPNSEGKTVVNKVKAYAKAIRSFTSDEMAIMDAYIAKLNEGTINITYQRPAEKCTICGADIEAEPMSAAALVFIRNQLGLMMII